MIISLSGRMKSGKDTVGKMIQYISYVEDEMGGISRYSFQDCLDGKMKKNLSKWQIKKFAYKVKQVASILTGIPVEDFNKQEVKDGILGEEWWRYEVSYRTYSRLSFSPEPEFHNEVYSTLLEAESCTKGNLELDGGSVDIKIVKPTIRQFLQEIGTEAIRNQIHPNAWVNALFAEYHCIHCGETPCSRSHNKVKGGSRKFPNWIITDARFPNEVKAIKDRNGILIRINRDWRLSALTDLENGGTASDFIDDQLDKVDEHPSETALDNYEGWDYVIDNNGSLEDLLDKVKEIYNQIK